MGIMDVIILGVIVVWLTYLTIQCQRINRFHEWEEQREYNDVVPSLLSGITRDDIPPVQIDLRGWGLSFPKKLKKSKTY